MVRVLRWWAFTILLLKVCKLSRAFCTDEGVKGCERIKMLAINLYRMDKFVRVGHHCSVRWFGRDRRCVGCRWCDTRWELGENEEWWQFPDKTGVALSADDLTHDESENEERPRFPYRQVLGWVPMIWLTMRVVKTVKTKNGGFRSVS